MTPREHSAPLPFGERWTRWVHAGNAVQIAFALALADGALDFVTGDDVTVNFLYQLPIFIATWFRRWPGGLFIAGICSGSRLVTLVLTSQPALAGYNLAWNAFAEVVAFVVVVALVDMARRRTRATTSKLDATTAQLRHADRLNTIGKLATGVAHELGSPLNVVMGHAELIATGVVAGDKVVRSAETILRQGDRMATIVRQLLTFGRRAGQGRAPTNLEELAKETVALLTPVGRKKSVDLVLDSGPEPVWAAVVPTEIEQVLGNLIVNAIQSSAPHSVVRVEVGQEKQTAATGSPPLATLVVRDAGSGILPEHLAHVFDPFFTTKEVGEGTGLGLSVSYGIIADHGGRIDVESQANVGTTFTVLLPIG